MADLAAISAAVLDGPARPYIYGSHMCQTHKE